MLTGTRVLVKDPKTKDVEVTDTFWFNKNFTNKMVSTFDYVLYGVEA